MWLSRIINKTERPPLAETGEVTLSSAENWEADASQRMRNINSYAPYGYSYKAPVGEEIFVLSAEGGFASLGTKASSQGLEAGEVKICSKGGASIELKNDGSIVLNGCVTVSRGGQITGWR